LEANEQNHTQRCQTVLQVTDDLSEKAKTKNIIDKFSASEQLCGQNIQ